MNFLSYLGGIPASAKEAVDVIAKGPAPSELELSLRQMHADHLAAMVAIKLLTEAVTSNSTGNLNTVLAQQERQAVLVTKLNDIKRNVTSSDSRHYAAFQLALNPMTRAINDLMDKVNGLSADIHDLKVDRHDELDAHTYVLNQKLTIVAERLDRLCRILVEGGLLKHPIGVTVAPPKPVVKTGRPEGRKNRTPEERYAYLKHRVQVARPGGKAQKKWQFLLTEFRNRTGMGA